MRGFVVEFERVFTDELAALAVAGGRQRLKVETADWSLFTDSSLVSGNC